MAVEGQGRRQSASNPIADDLRRQCMVGQLTPGMRLPRREELIRRYAASATTVQQAINLLVADGLLEARGRAGTFVAGRPRHVTDVALVFPARRDNPFAWRHFYDVMAASAALWQGEQARRIRMYCCPLNETDVNGDLERLCDDLQNLRLAGVITATTVAPPDLRQWREKFDTPLVGIAPTPVETAEMSVVVLSYDSFFSRAIDFLAQHGRRRVAIVLSPEMYFQMEHEHIDREAQRFGVDIRPMWRQLVGPGVPICARSVTHLLMSAPPADRPDGLIVADDNMVIHAIQGLHDAGVRPGAGLDLVMHGNFPSALPFSDVGITRLGFDSRAILDAGVQLIDAWREKGGNAGSIVLNAVFEDELWNRAQQ